MTFNSINEAYLIQTEGSQTTLELNTTQFKPIFEFANHNYDNNTNDISDAKLVTENFKNEIMQKLDMSRTNPDMVKYYLNKLIKNAQILNGVRKNNLKPQGNSQQNELYNQRLKEYEIIMCDYAQIIGCGLSIEQDSKSGLYKLNINNKLFEIPSRNVAILPNHTEDGIEFIPEIVDEIDWNRKPQSGPSEIHW